MYNCPPFVTITKDLLPTVLISYSRQLVVTVVSEADEGNILYVGSMSGLSLAQGCKGKESLHFSANLEISIPTRAPEHLQGPV